MLLISSGIEHNELLPNPYYAFDNSPLCSIPEDMINIIYKQENFLKRIIEEICSCDELFNLLRFLIWENPDITWIILHDIIGSVSHLYTYNYF
ncbi:unnamed protein product [Rotaria sp. Silwood1]|nr:unnamed protein product [Rotaria sp. Silwood1]CAF5174974.1 unnamed protein product [Rotaria sp. Silwood1]